MNDRPTPEQIADDCEIEGGRWLLQYLQADLGYRIIHEDDPVPVERVWLDTADNITYAFIAAAEEPT